MLGADTSNLPAVLGLLLGAGGISGIISLIGQHRRDRERGRIDASTIVVEGFTSLVDQLQEQYERCLNEKDTLREQLRAKTEEDQVRDRRLEMIERDLGPSRGRRPPPPRSSRRSPE